MRKKNKTLDAIALKNRGITVKSKKPLFLILTCIVLVLTFCGVVVGRQIVETNRINKAKSIISQLDINTTYKESEFIDDDDWDNDGILNGKEKREGTDIQNEDSDNDGISDGDEIKLGTNPKKDDTDGDKLLDGYELMAGLDPKKTCTDGTTNDIDREVTITRTNDLVKIDITGTANVADTTINHIDIFGITSNTSVVSHAYDFFSNYSFNTAKLTFTLDNNAISKMGYSVDDLSILSFDSSTLKYTKIDSTISKDKKTISAEISQLGTYVVGVENTVNAEATTRIALLVDNSGSMYPKELCSTSTENDVDFKRIDFAENLINKIDGDYEFSVSKFTATYTKLQGFTSDEKKLFKALNNIRNNSEVFNGTHLQNSLNSCMNEFKNDGNTKYRNIIVMLTDGESDEASPKSIKQLAEIASDKNVVILTVGLGTDIDRSWLQELAHTTGGKHYSASDANALDAVYKQIVTTLNYDLVRYSQDEDDNSNGYALYNTGFSPKVNGFSFKNIRTTTTSSLDFGMAVLARDWYLGNLCTSTGDISPQDESTLKYDAPGYDISQSELLEKYRAKTTLFNIAPASLLSTYSDVKEYLDYSSTGDTLKIDADLATSAKQRGWKIMVFPISSGNLEWKYVQLLSLDIKDSIPKIEQHYSEWEAKLYSMLYRLNALQWDDSNDEFNLTNNDEGFERLQNLLSQGIPVVTTIDDTHTINSIGLIQDSDCHRDYILQVYDNNYPGKTKEIYITKSPIGHFEIEDGKVTLLDTTFKYVATYEGKQVGISFSDVQVH